MTPNCESTLKILTGDSFPKMEITRLERTNPHSCYKQMQCAPRYKTAIKNQALLLSRQFIWSGPRDHTDIRCIGPLEDRGSLGSRGYVGDVEVEKAAMELGSHVQDIRSSPLKDDDHMVLEQRRGSLECRVDRLDTLPVPRALGRFSSPGGSPPHPYLSISRSCHSRFLVFLWIYPRFSTPLTRSIVCLPPL